MRNFWPKTNLCSKFQLNLDFVVNQSGCLDLWPYILKLTAYLSQNFWPRTNLCAKFQLNLDFGVIWSRYLDLRPYILKPTIHLSHFVFRGHFAKNYAKTGTKWPPNTSRNSHNFLSTSTAFQEIPMVFRTKTVLVLKTCENTKHRKPVS